MGNIIKFRKASKAQAKLRLGLVGPPGSGKTWTSLEIATGIGGNIALLDTENASASKYADKFTFDTVVLSDFSPRNYVDVIKEAAASGYSTLVIDSLSHAWAGKGGALEMADNAARKSKSGNTYTAWRDVTPEHNLLVDAIVQAPINIIATMRTKIDYVIEQVNGKSTPRKVGLAPVTGKGMEYEFDIVMDLDDGGRVSVTKSRYSNIAGKGFIRPGKELGEELAAWLSDGTPNPPSPVNEILRDIEASTSREGLLLVASKVQSLTTSNELKDFEIKNLRQAYMKREREIG